MHLRFSQISEVLFNYQKDDHSASLKQLAYYSELKEIETFSLFKINRSRYINFINSSPLTSWILSNDFLLIIVTSVITRLPLILTTKYQEADFVK